MKKIIFISFCLYHITGVGLSQNTTNHLQKWTLNEVKSMVKKYNLQDSVTATKNNGLMYKEKAEIERWGQSWAKSIDERAKITTYFKDTETVRNRADYFKLLDSYPSIKQVLIKSHGGEIGFQKYKEVSLKTLWRVYRNDRGELAFRPASNPISEEEKYLGKRVDTLPPQKE